MSTHLTIVAPFNDKGYSLTKTVESTVKDVKQDLSRLLNTTVTALRLEIDEDELVDEDTLTQVGCVEGGDIEIKMTMFLDLGDTATKSAELDKLKERNNKNSTRAMGVKKKPEQHDKEVETFDSFLASQPLNRRPKLIYEPEPKLLTKDEKKSAMNRYKKKNQYHLVECEKPDGSKREVKVEIDHMFGKKPFLGGFRHKLTSKEYHHASSQTSIQSSSDTKETKTMIRYVSNLKASVFGSVRSSRSHNVRPFVRLVQVCLKSLNLHHSGSGLSLRSPLGLS